MNSKPLEFIQQLTRYKNRFPRERLVAGFFDLVHSQSECIARSCFTDGHITASACVVNQRLDQCLLIKHQKLRKWLQLGGHIEDNESPLAASVREAIEESGLSMTPLSSEIFDLDIHDIPPNAREFAHRHYDVRFLLTSRDDTSVRLSELSGDFVKWVALRDVSKYTTERSIHRLIEKTTNLQLEIH